MRYNSTIKWTILFFLMAMALPAQTVFESETVLVNPEAAIRDQMHPDKWCIWSTDVNKRKWSGEIVLRSPVTMEDHKTHDEGAPILHFRLPIPKPGLYSIEMKGSPRPLGLSLDGGKTWQRFNYGFIVKNLRIDNGVFDCWLDDCYADPQSPGPAYIDSFLVWRQEDVPYGMANPDFEIGTPGEPARGWSWFHREGKGSALISAIHKEGHQSLHIVAPEGEDWAMTNTYMHPVKSGEHFVFRCWIRGSSVYHAYIRLIGYKDGARVTWNAARSQPFFLSPGKWQMIQGRLDVDEDIDAVTVGIVGYKEADFYIDNLSLEPAKPRVLKQLPLVKGHAKKRIVENLGRGVVAQEVDNGVYVSWRLLKEDPKQAAFDLFRKIDGQKTKLNETPIVQTCDFLDKTPVDDATYIVREIHGGRPGEAIVWKRDAAGKPAYKSYKLSDPKAKVQAIGIGDLNGDGTYDFVVKHPSTCVDPWDVVWFKSPDTYKLEAFLSDGTRLWTVDLGWDIECGIWYSPFCVQDLDGDGKAEVITKISSGDHLEPDGHVYEGDEYFVVLDGMTGKEIARAPWIPRDLFGSTGKAAYHFAARNLICIAYLDGKTPCICILRGTYDDMAVETWQLVKGKLKRLWKYDNSGLSRKWVGQGAHTNYALDVDGDGRDEIVLGSAVLDDNGMPLWTTGKGHPDGVFFGKLMPDKPGLQVAWNLETAQKKGGLCMADAKTGRLYWELDEPTNHVDGKGMVADIDPLYPGCEVAGADMHVLEPGTNKRGLVKGWLFTADGIILENSKEPTYRFGRSTLYWDADLQKEIFAGRISDHNGGFVTPHIYYGLLVFADILGDWREEIITCPAEGEFRVYTTDLPAMDRRPCLMQEHNYRMRVSSNSMGYATEALLPYDLESEAPNLNGTFIQGKGDTPDILQIIVVASKHEPLNGTLSLHLPQGVESDIISFPVALNPGERTEQRMTLKADRRVNEPVHFLLNRPDDTPLAGQVLLRMNKR